MLTDRSAMEGLQVISGNVSTTCRTLLIAIQMPSVAVPLTGPIDLYLTSYRPALIAIGN
jgi:hypothetical protein